MTSVFISYARADENLKERLLVHLAALRREHLIGIWHDRMLKPGEHLDTAIEAELAAADLVILLISPDFINSNYCTEKEMQRAFVRAKGGQCKVAAVILKPCQWHNIPIDGGGRLGDFLAMPRDAKPVTQWSHRDAAWDSVVADIRGLITDGRPTGTLGQPQQKDAAPSAVSTAVYGKRDVWLADAIWRVFLGTWDLPPHDERAPAGQNENQRFFDLVTKEFRQAAFEGQLPIWAKRSNSDLWEDVPEVYWKDHRISYLNVIREDPTKLSVEEVGSLKRSSEWREFMTSRGAVNTIWPAENK